MIKMPTVLPSSSALPRPVVVDDDPVPQAAVQQTSSHPVSYTHLTLPTICSV